MKLGEGATPGPWTLTDDNCTLLHNQIPAAALAPAMIERNQEMLRALNQAPLLVEVRDVLEYIANELQHSHVSHNQLICMDKAHTLLAKLEAE